tara:strand:- start:40 stop:207 length:168 start_codon:yes stop_codon:yes gene_type:complete
MTEKFTEEDCESCYNLGKSYCNHGHQVGCCCSECTTDWRHDNNLDENDEPMEESK